MALEIEKTSIEGLVVLLPSTFKDERGVFSETFSQRDFYEATGTDVVFVQDNESVSVRGVLRGLHFQTPPYGMGKLVRVVQGSVIDVAVDIRKASPTYGQHVQVLLSASNRKQFWIPEGFAHGFLALEDDTRVSYKCTSFYNPSAEESLLWKDSELAIDWSLNDEPLVSEKDNQAGAFTDFASKF
jgi:dTDP-4-dehydrorhamnose 3,5-epimerase|tara:strand:- start:38 stop:592 length:555 start_codon:yes stop_codon:yes gene_type:complete